jgi:hypothetical protein
MTLRLKGLVGLTVYKADLRQTGSATIVGTAVDMEEKYPGYYEGTPTGKPKGQYQVTFRNGATPVAIAAPYEWSGTAEISLMDTADKVSILAGLVTGGDRFTTTALSNAPAGGATPTQVTDIVVAARDAVLARGNLAWITGNTIAPDNASAVAAKTAAELVRDRLTTTRAAKLDQDFATPTQVTAAQTAILTQGNSSWTPDNAGITAAKTAAERLTTTRAARLDTVTVAADLSAIAKTTEVTAARDAILTQGNSAWTPNNAGIASTLTISNVLRGLVNAGGTAYTATALAAAPTGSGGGGGGLLPDERVRLFLLPTAVADLDPVLDAIAQIPTATAVFPTYKRKQ